MAEELMIKVEDVYKKYRLGVIGGGTLTGDLQSWWAKVRHKEDPNSKIGDKYYDKNETFYALKGISFEVRKGEALGIIGGNGAGKSTTLKLLSQVTAPTSGKIYLNGRVASMLEVGTGFHPELTGRENIYLNGAILGMTKAEIDNKIEEIIDFSECRQFIDTPVKRYSSGMYVKLAFSVAAHLDSEIMIMDEVLAVGDMAFQKKCINKMIDVSKNEGRTILYVSHNMNTIRNLCDRCIVLNKGKVVFCGDVEESIRMYLGNKINSESCVNVEDMHRDPEFDPHPVTMKTIETLDNSTASVYYVGDKINMRLTYTSKRNISDVYIRLIIKTIEGSPITMLTVNKGFEIKKNEHEIIEFKIDISHLAPGRYTISPVMYEVNNLGGNVSLDGLKDAYYFEVAANNGFNNNMVWQARYWGHYYSEPMSVRKIESVQNHG